MGECGFAGSCSSSLADDSTFSLSLYVCASAGFCASSSSMNLFLNSLICFRRKAQKLAMAYNSLVATRKIPDTYFDESIRVVKALAFSCQKHHQVTRALTCFYSIFVNFEERECNSEQNLASLKRILANANNSKVKLPLLESNPKAVVLSESGIHLQTALKANSS